jgi:transposase-like protein
MIIELKVNQIKAALLLSNGESVTSTADKIGVTRVTIHRWLNDNNEFVAYLNSLKNEQLEAARTAIQSSASLAVLTLTEIIKTSSNDTVRLAACKEILAMSGLTKDSLSLYAWGVGPETAAEVRAKKKSDAMWQSLTTV